MNLCLSMIDVGLNNPVVEEPDKTEEKDKDRAKCTASVIHQADKCLRKMVSAKIRDIKDQPPASKELLQSHASHLNSAKDELVEDLKTGFALLPVDVVKGIGERQPNAVDNLTKCLEALFELRISETKKVNK